MINKLRTFPEWFFAEPKRKVTAGFLALSITLVADSLIPILIRFSENEISPTATIFNRMWINALGFGIWFGW